MFASRDNLFSPSYIRRLGIKSEISIIPDDLYFLSEKFNLCKVNHNLELPLRYIVLECYCSINDKNISRLKQFVRKMGEKYNLEVVFLALGVDWGGTFQGEIIKENIPKVFLALPEQRVKKIEDINFIVRNATFVICQRYHLFLTALSNNIPCIQVIKETCDDFRYYYCKTKGLLNQVLGNQIYHEEIFFKLDLWEALDDIERSLEDIISGEQEYFNEKKTMTEKVLYKIRKVFLEENLFVK